MTATPFYHGVRFEHSVPASLIARASLLVLGFVWGIPPRMEERTVGANAMMIKDSSQIPAFVNMFSRIRNLAAKLTCNLLIRRR